MERVPTRERVRRLKGSLADTVYIHSVAADVNAGHDPASNVCRASSVICFLSAVCGYAVGIMGGTAESAASSR